VTSSVYAPLGAYLAGQPGPTHTLTFPEVEAILGRPLPASAATAQAWAWWTNDAGHSQADYGWLAAGWLVERIDRRQQTVTFRKGGE
jgi:hypothetical protein